VLKSNQFSIGKLIYITLFVATIIASLQAGYPYGFIYTFGFIIVAGSYVAWSITRESPEPVETILNEWDTEDIVAEDVERIDKK
jgi:hypothetical protein